MRMWFHSPTGFSESSVRFLMRLAAPSRVPHFSAGPRRATISSTQMSSQMHQKSPALPWCIWTSMEAGNMP